MKLYKTKISRILVGLVANLGVLSVALIISTISWFTVNYSFVPDNVTSSVVTSYFDSGSGTESDPFVITRPVHYYNLVYLHENNEYQVDSTNFAEAELWFQFGKLDIDGNASTSDDSVYQFYEYDDNGVLQEESYSSFLNMNYYSDDNALPPLGSSEHPFLGHIIGNNLTVSNLHIDGKGYSDIGIFGYVSSGATISNIYYESPYIDAGGNLSSATSDSNHSSHDTYTYIGYLAGHVYNASSTFSNVYVNNCELTNTTGNETEMINTYGYFGHVDFPSDVSADSASFAVEAKASDVYDAIDSSYSEASTHNAITRKTEYSATSENYSNAVTTSDSTYTMGKYSSSYPYSLSTIGYTDGETVTKHVRYYIGENNLGTLATTTTQLKSEPADWSTYEDGTYIYWDDTDGCWYYAVVESSTTSDPVDITYNCFVITYTYGSTTYYLKYSDATLISTSTAPTNDTIDDYYFVFKPSEGSYGISEFTSNSNSENVYIYSPAYKKYLYIEEVSSTNEYTPIFQDTADLTFTINGTPSTSITATIGNYTDALFGTTYIYSCRNVSTNTPTTFTIGTPSTRQSVTGYTYNLTTSISAGDTVAIAAGWDTDKIGTYDFAGYYIMGTQNTNQRATYQTTINNDAIELGGGCEFLIATGSQSGTYNLIDQSAAYKENNSGYLYAAGGTGSNYLKTNTQSTAGTNADAKITFDSDGYAEIVFQGDSTRNHMYMNANYSGTYPNYKSYSPIFSCYAEKSNTGNINGLGDETDYYQYHLPKLYKKTTIYGAMETYSTATEKTYTSASTSEQTITEYGLRVALLSSDSSNPSSYSTTNFDIPASRSVTFNMNSSQVTYQAITENYWAKVTAQSEVISGERYLIVYEDSSTIYTFDGSLTTLDVSSNYTTSFTASDGIISYSDATLASSFVITSSGSSWYIQSNSGYYIGRSANSNGLSSTTSSSDSNYLNTITINSGVATITGTGDAILQYNASGNRFRYYTSTQSSISLYKLIESDADNATYISDLIGDRYDSDRIDVVGPTAYSSSYYSFTETSSVTASPTTGNTFYTTSYIHSGISIIIDKTGSRDLGHLIFTYSDASNVPYFITNSGSEVTLSTAGARDVDSDSTDSVHSYLYNMNSSIVTSLAYCGLDSSGNIVSLDSNDLTQYVIVLGASTSTQIQNVQYTFINSAGNVGNFGSVDYRTATYESDGSLSSDSESAQVTGSAISLFYDVATSDQVFYIKVEYDQDSNTYTVTATSSVTTTLTVFIYDNDATVVVNDTPYLATEVITITAT